MFDLDLQKQVLDDVQRWLPTTTPEELVQACKCEPIDPDWPIQSPLNALFYLEAWSRSKYGKKMHSSEHNYGITHSHHHEYADLERLGVERLYKESIWTKYVSIGWHLAGRYTYDNALIEVLDQIGWGNKKLVDFGAAPWIQACFYSKKGFEVTAINQTLDSDCHQFGKFLAYMHGITNIKEYASDDLARDNETFDIVYAIDVFEHIPPDGDTPGWLKYADRLLKCLKPGGIWYVNSPFGIAPGKPVPVDSHPVHYTSPIQTSEWCEQKGLVYKNNLWWKP